MRPRAPSGRSRRGRHCAPRTRAAPVPRSSGRPLPGSSAQPTMSIGQSERATMGYVSVALVLGVGLVVAVLAVGQSDGGPLLLAAAGVAVSGVAEAARAQIVGRRR